MSINPNQETAATDERTSAELRRVLTGMQDALTDEMVTRIADTLSSSAGLLDQLGRSGADRAIPLLAYMVENGDLERITQLARVVSAVQDAVTDEMVVRLTELVGGAMTLLDRLHRSGWDELVAAVPRILAMVEHLDQQHVVEDLAHCLDEATTQAASAPPAAGGLKGLWAIMREPDAQESLQFLLLISKQFRACRTGRHATQGT